MHIKITKNQNITVQIAETSKKNKKVLAKLKMACIFVLTKEQKIFEFSSAEPS